MVSDLTKTDLRRIVHAAGVGPHADQDRALVLLATCTGMELRSVVEVMSCDFQRVLGCRNYPVGEVFSTRCFEEKPRQVGLDAFARGIIEKAFPPPANDDEDDLLNYLPDNLFTAPDGVRPMSELRAKRIVARAFVAAGQPPQRAAARLLEAFHRLATKSVPKAEPEGAVLDMTKPKPKPKKRSRGPRRPTKEKNRV